VYTEKSGHLTHNMAGHAKSMSSKKREASRAQEAALKEAVLLYRGELAKLEGERNSEAFAQRFKQSGGSSTRRWLYLWRL